MVLKKNKQEKKKMTMVDEQGRVMKEKISYEHSCMGVEQGRSAERRLTRIHDPPRALTAVRMTVR